MPDTALTQTEPGPPAELGWMLPGHAPAPAQAMARIQALCEAHADLYTAVITVLATHPDVPRERLGPALQRCRPELATCTPEDLASLQIAAWNGGKSGFEAVLRTRASAPKRTGSLSWVKD